VPNEGPARRPDGDDPAEEVLLPKRRTSRVADECITRACRVTRVSQELAQAAVILGADEHLAARFFLAKFKPSQMQLMAALRGTRFLACECLAIVLPSIRTRLRKASPRTQADLLCSMGVSELLTSLGKGDQVVRFVEVNFPFDCTLLASGCLGMAAKRS